VNFFTPKLMKIRWSSLFLGSFAPHLQIKLTIELSVKSSKESIETVSLLKTGNKVVEVG
jgi:hypothetical protein